MLFSRAAGSVACALMLVACSSDTKTENTAASAGPAVQMGQAFPSKRCDENKAAGVITYLSGYDFAASASIVDVLVAKQKGYYDDICLDVQIKAGFSSDNYAPVAANSAQFASGGSFSGLVTNSLHNPDANLVALAVEGRSANDTLIVKQGAGTDLIDLSGATIGVKKALPASIRAMLAKAGMVEGTDYTVKPIDGFDPAVHIALPDIAGFTGFRSNEPGQLDRAGIAYTEFDPSGEGVPGSFGVLYTSRTFLAAHPTAATDFMRATMKGLADAINDPSAAAMVAIDFIDNNGNPNGLSPEGEAFRWQTEANLVADKSTSTEPLGMPEPSALRGEVESYAAVGLFDGKAPDISKLFDASILETVYDPTGVVVWPNSA
jgi:ABC-type nitrate/sulfonate/bicarbonate transport system substrate-binding protein